jgi:hypothetical protein
MLLGDAIIAMLSNDAVWCRTLLHTLLHSLNAFAPLRTSQQSGLNASANASPPCYLKHLLTNQTRRNRAPARVTLWHGQKIGSHASSLTQIWAPYVQATVERACFKPQLMFCSNMPNF